ncbi:hypothetical protein SADUNF_Sadunf05G0184800 [Salix dunnii]|uniref:Uncharacterized protein n=1 Tax=Salix dunnii TaxID=1413687 RepID=A0A835K9F6_9ROSI|nr:hypothetical protein SADUNF_Sadunf05G0184800 [Salix dunnii]
MLGHHTDHLKKSLLSMGQQKFTVSRQSSEAGHVHSLKDHLLSQLPFLHKEEEVDVTLECDCFSLAVKAPLDLCEDTRSSPALVMCMRSPFAILTRRIGSLLVSSVVFAKLFPCLTNRAPSTSSSSRMALLCSWACNALSISVKAAKCKERRQQDNLFTDSGEASVTRGRDYSRIQSNNVLRRKKLCFSLRIFLEMEEGPLDEKYAKKVGLYCGATLQLNCHNDTAELYRDDGLDLG